MAGDQYRWRMAPTVGDVRPDDVRQFNGGQTITRQVQIIGIDPEERAKTGDFAEFLTRTISRAKRIPPSSSPTCPNGCTHEHARRRGLLKESSRGRITRFARGASAPQALEAGARPAARSSAMPWRPSTGSASTSRTTFIAPVPGRKINPGRSHSGRRSKPEPGVGLVHGRIGYFKSGMSEYDSQHVYVPLERLQEAPTAGRRQGNGAVNADPDQGSRSPASTSTSSWPSDIQTALEQPSADVFPGLDLGAEAGPLLAAVAVEQSILNMLLFFIIAVAGFGILAIFSMIVVEKTRDIGVHEGPGGVVGRGPRDLPRLRPAAGDRRQRRRHGLGGLAFVHKDQRHREVAEPTPPAARSSTTTIYYFNEIPTRVEPSTVAWIVGGALLISAVVASVWPAQRRRPTAPGPGVDGSSDLTGSPLSEVGGVVLEKSRLG